MFGEICILIQISKAHDVPQTLFSLGPYMVRRNNYYVEDRQVIFCEIGKTIQ